MKKQSGFAIIELALVVVVLAAIAGVGYYVWANRVTPATATTVSSPTASLGYQSPAVATPAAPQVTNAADLNSAMQALNGTSVSSSNVDSSQLSSQSAAF